NELRVVTSGKAAKLFVNGKLFQELSGEPPADGSEIGLLACSPDDASAAVQFDNLVISGPGGVVSADAGNASLAGYDGTEACKPTSETVFKDSFDDLAASWGASDNYHLEGGKLAIQPPAGFNTPAINNASLYDDVDVCVEMSASVLRDYDCGSIIF